MFSPTMCWTGSMLAIRFFCPDRADEFVGSESAQDF